MDDLCASSNAVNGQHAKEYYETSQGEIWDRCRNCGNIFFDRYIECGGG